jgi:3-oxoacyl-[acyl-carrier protein] reductase
VNNAGPRLGGDQLAHWARVLDTNLQGTVRVTSRAIEAMRDRGGAVVNIAAAEGLGLAASAQPVFAAAKAGVIRFTAALSGLAGECGVRVNCIAPDRIDSPEALAELVLALSQHVDCAGRVVLYRAGSHPEILAAGDAGYRMSEPF